jgi:hypothetical protein
MGKRIYPTEVTVDAYVTPSGFPGAGQTRFTVSISDDKHSKELLNVQDWFEAIRFARRSAGRRGLPIADKTARGRGSTFIPEGK